jgi:hypothetical protein
MVYVLVGFDIRGVTFIVELAGAPADVTVAVHGTVLKGSVQDSRTLPSVPAPCKGVTVIWELAWFPEVTGDGMKPATVRV